MVFSSLEFIFIFLPAFLLLYGFSPPAYKNAVIFMCSVVFYGMGVKSPVYIILFLLTLLFNHIVTQFMEAYPKGKKVWLVIGLVFNFCWLLFFKYTGFIFENINAFFHAKLPVKDIVLPIGISFYTFQNVSYIIDVYRGKVRPESNPINYGAYISMFPQLIAGPIVTYESVSEQLHQRQHTISKVEDGLKTFTIGLGFKVLIANQLSGLWSDISMIGYESISTPLAWLGIIAYSFQLYFDFYGYSLMAIGLGKIMAFDLPINFDFPYLSLTMTEFWRRWHITLGTWFRDYIYIPLGGNRKGKSRQIINTLAVWLFTGLWHGASWNFVLWGLVLFVLIILEKFVIGDFLNEHKFIGHCYMFLIIPVTWLIFAVTDFHELGIYFKRLFPFIPQEKGVILDGDYIKYFRTYWKFFVAGVLFSTEFPQMLYRRFKKSVVCVIFLLAIFWGSVYCMYKGMNDPFMYFRF
ncbi:MAG: MBOAT family protein [Ruminococcus sp.]|nr:MBOAT family protein [Ruminococcus sp.]